ncbi:SPOR domain-containing protein [Halomonas huangheensis]|uniref:SPOR domain-containing protein n=1 Tax=Halomonas huangheensis TaxID=1178482 RepID=W1N2U6_9GAMM|nr:SPOR domain-containing protein [Halomonas huangheensis]ALM52281.1 hypothetical protein AR456_08260 [Halomonas huangheensis]ERL49511.1 hypothetical protein BJB45_06940 [Halomonas huangheensis]
MRERISGVVIVVALAVIFVPMLFDEPDNADQRPDPVLTIEPPVDVERRDVPAPEAPDGLGEIVGPQSHEQREQVLDEAQQQTQSRDAESEQQRPEQEPDTASEAPREDPIAAIAQAADQRLTDSSSNSSSSTPAASGSGEWSVQIGSFGKVANADGALQRLRNKGYPAWKQQRSDGLTAVYAGPYTTTSEAENVMGRIKGDAELGFNGFLKRAAP